MHLTNVNIKRFWLLCLTLLVALMAPLKAVSTPITAQAIDPCVVVRDCCARMIACCCEIAPAKPAPPADVASAAALPPLAKFVSVNGNGRIISNDLPSLAAHFIVIDKAIYLMPVAVLTARPLYILNRALLI